MAAPPGPVDRAAAYLAREVPRWSRENGCYSCHNNGDGARVLFLARRHGQTAPDAALADTLDWLRKPAAWDETHGTPGVSNLTLARIQFASALLEARLSDARPLREAAESLVKLQAPDGSWPVDAGGIPGAPVTYGRALATYMARRVLEAAKLTAPASKASAWLRAARPENVVDGAALVLAGRRDCVDFLKRAQTRDGSWGEVFDTALAVLAMQSAGEAAAAARGRDFLVRMQQPEGGWQETTRPSGGVSYAEHISTTAWALQALLR
jgi:squalene cyclase